MTVPPTGVASICPGKPVGSSAVGRLVLGMKSLAVGFVFAYCSVDLPTLYFF